MSQLEPQYRLYAHWLREFIVGDKTSVGRVADAVTYDLRGRFTSSFRVLVYNPQRIWGGDWELPEFRIAENSEEYPGGTVQVDFAQKSTAEVFRSAVLEMGSRSVG